MPISNPAVLNRRDFLLAFAVAVITVMVYLRVLAPDVLYGDSGEFQTLAYTWGTTHTTGYPVYLVFARVIGFLPIGTLAWRINFASAVFAAVTLAGIYLIARLVTGSNWVLPGSLVLLLSYTFWSQSIIAEVYTLATAFIAVILLIVIMWYNEPKKRHILLFTAGFLMGAGLGVHLFIVLIAPAVFGFVLWVAFGDRQRWWLPLWRLVSGGLSGLLFFFLLFAYIDSRPTPTNIFTTSIIPSAETWGLQASDLDSAPERFWISVSGHQWRDRMVPGDVNYTNTLNDFHRKTLPKEFATFTLILVVFGLVFLLVRHQRLFLFFALALLTTFAAGFLYFPGDKFIFYLPFYLLIAILCGIGTGFIHAEAASRLNKLQPSIRPLPLIALTVVIMALCAAPLATTRWRSLERGVSGFITEDYVYPVTRPNEARAAAECAVSKIAEPDAFLVLDWQALFAIYYVAHVEQGRTGIVMREARPYPAQELALTLQNDIAMHVRDGQAVYVDNDYSILANTYTLTEVTGSCRAYRLFKLAPRQ
ncbi:MAG: DUF2723 domain-containing protein [Chloroflexi bacterium]|nr:DUF2723 domain-containing protein [Chloroflexota bacterium]MCC6891970.1 DUF2723 domain-containing protein [Anaerolineae bacterium]